MEGYAALYFDGETAQRRQVEVHVAADGLNIADCSGAALALWRFAELRALVRLRAMKPARLSCDAAPDARLYIDDTHFAQRVLPLAPQLHRRHGGGVSWSQVAMAAGVAALFVLAVIYGVPWASRPIAAAIPAHWVEGLGKTMRANMLTKTRVCGGEAGGKSLRQLRDRLAKEIEIPYAIEVTVAEKDMVNAFALPGGQIVIFSKLLDITTSPDELAGILAHELGHAARRHPMEGALRAAGISLLVDMMVSDNSGLAGAAAGLGGVLVAQSYSREAEREADRIAIATLGKAGINPDGLARAFQHMAQERAKDSKSIDTKKSAFGRMSYYLRSHPDLADRVKSAKGAAKVEFQPALAPDAWRSLKQICG